MIMGPELRVVLLVASLFTLTTFMHKIRKNHLQIEYAVFWMLLSIGLFTISVFPSIAAIMSNLIGIQSPVNFVYLSAIAILLYRLFAMTIKQAKLDRQITELAQHMALFEKELNDGRK